MGSKGRVLGLQVAAALHDNCRALLVGKRTFGKVCFRNSAGDSQIRLRLLVNNK